MVVSSSEAAAEHPAKGTTETVGAAARSTPGTEPRTAGPGTQGSHTGEPLSVWVQRLHSDWPSPLLFIQVTETSPSKSTTIEQQGTEVTFVTPGSDSELVGSAVKR